jgi:hypothetical protein
MTPGKTAILLFEQPLGTRARRLDHQAAIFIRHAVWSLRGTRSSPLHAEDSRSPAVLVE